MMLQVVEDVPVIKLSMIELSACELQMMLQVVEDVPVRMHSCLPNATHWGYK